MKLIAALTVVLGCAVSGCAVSHAASGSRTPRRHDTAARTALLRHAHQPDVIKKADGDPTLAHLKNREPARVLATAKQADMLPGVPQ